MGVHVVDAPGASAVRVGVVARRSSRISELNFEFGLSVDRCTVIELVAVVRCRFELEERVGLVLDVFHRDAELLGETLEGCVLRTESEEELVVERCETKGEIAPEDIVRVRREVFWSGGGLLLFVVHFELVFLQLPCV